MDIQDFVRDSIRPKLEKLLLNKDIGGPDFMSQMQMITISLVVTVAVLGKDLGVISSYIKTEEKIMYEGYHLVAEKWEIVEEELAKGNISLDSIINVLNGI